MFKEWLRNFLGVKEIMAKFEDFQTLLDTLGAQSDAIAATVADISADVDWLKEQLSATNAGLSESQEADIFAALEGVKSKLDALKTAASEVDSKTEPKPPVG